MDILSQYESVIEWIDPGFTEGLVVGATVAGIVVVVAYSNQVWDWVKTARERAKMRAQREKDLYLKTASDLIGTLEYRIKDKEITPQEAYKIVKDIGRFGPFYALDFEAQARQVFAKFLNEQGELKPEKQKSKLALSVAHLKPA